MINYKFNDSFTAPNDSVTPPSHDDIPNNTAEYKGNQLSNTNVKN